MKRKRTEFHYPENRMSIFGSGFLAVCLLITLPACTGTTGTAVSPIPPTLIQSTRRPSDPMEGNTPNSIIPDDTVIQGELQIEDVSVVIPPDLCTGGTPVRTSNVEHPFALASFGPMPEHWSIELTDCLIWNTGGRPLVTVFRAEEYAGYSDQAAETVAALRRLLENPGMDLTEPFFGHVTFHPQACKISSPVSIGVRFLTQVFSGFVPVTNADLFYFFQGLSEDGRFLITLQYPVHASFLSEEPGATSPENGIRFPDHPDDQSFSEYLETVVEQMDSAPSSEFDPVLSDLDSMAASVVVVVP
jgi:hypothetical protein